MKNIVGSQIKFFFKQKPEKKWNNNLTVDNKLLALLLSHASAILSINKPVNIRAARAADCKRLTCQEPF